MMKSVYNEREKTEDSSEEAKTFPSSTIKNNEGTHVQRVLLPRPLFFGPDVPPRVLNELQSRVATAAAESVQRKLDREKQQSSNKTTNDDEETEEEDDDDAIQDDNLRAWRVVESAINNFRPQCRDISSSSLMNPNNSYISTYQPKWGAGENVCTKFLKAETQQDDEDEKKKNEVGKESYSQKNKRSNNKPRIENLMEKDDKINNIYRNNLESSGGCVPLFGCDDVSIPSAVDLAIFATDEDVNRSNQCRREEETIERNIVPNIFGVVNCPSPATSIDDSATWNSRTVLSQPNLKPRHDENQKTPGNVKSMRKFYSKSRDKINPDESPNNNRGVFGATKQQGQFTAGIRKERKNRTGWWNSDNTSSSIKEPVGVSKTSSGDIETGLNPNPHQLRSSNLSLNNLPSATSTARLLPFLSDRSPNFRHLQIEAQEITFHCGVVEPLFCSISIYHVDTGVDSSSRSVHISSPASPSSSKLLFCHHLSSLKHDGQQETNSRRRPITNNEYDISTGTMNSSVTKLVSNLNQNNSQNNNKLPSSKKNLVTYPRCGKVTETLHFDYYNNNKDVEKACSKALWPYGSKNNFDPSERHMGTNCGVFPLPPNLDTDNLYVVLVVHKVLSDDSDLEPYLKIPRRSNKTEDSKKDSQTSSNHQSIDLNRLRQKAKKASDRLGKFLTPFSFGIASLKHSIGDEIPKSLKSVLVSIPLIKLTAGQGEKPIIDTILKMYYPNQVAPDQKSSTKGNVSIGSLSSGASNVTSASDITKGGNACLILRNIGYLGLRSVIKTNKNSKSPNLACNRLVDFTGELQIKRKPLGSSTNNESAKNNQKKSSPQDGNFDSVADSWGDDFITEPTTDGGRNNSFAISSSSSKASSSQENISLYAQEMAPIPLAVSSQPSISNDEKNKIQHGLIRHSKVIPTFVNHYFHTSFYNEMICQPKKLHFCPKRNIVVQIKLCRYLYNETVDSMVAIPLEKPSIHNVRRGPFLVNECYTTCAYHVVDPLFLDEFKIKLPLLLDKGLSILLSVYNLSVKGKRKFAKSVTESAKKISTRLKNPLSPSASVDSPLDKEYDEDDYIKGNKTKDGNSDESSQYLELLGCGILELAVTSNCLLPNDVHDVPIKYLSKPLYTHREGTRKDSFRSSPTAGGGSDTNIQTPSSSRRFFPTSPQISPSKKSTHTQQQLPDLPYGTLLLSPMPSHDDSTFRKNLTLRKVTSERDFPSASVSHHGNGHSDEKVQQDVDENKTMILQVRTISLSSIHTQSKKLSTFFLHQPSSPNHVPLKSLSCAPWNLSGEELSSHIASLSGRKEIIQEDEILLKNVISDITETSKCSHSELVAHFIRILMQLLRTMVSGTGNPDLLWANPSSLIPLRLQSFSTFLYVIREVHNYQHKNGVTQLNGTEKWDYTSMSKIISMMFDDDYLFGEFNNEVYDDSSVAMFEVDNSNGNNNNIDSPMVPLFPFNNNKEETPFSKKNDSPLKSEKFSRSSTLLADTGSRRENQKLSGTDKHLADDTNKTLKKLSRIRKRMNERAPSDRTSMDDLNKNFLSMIQSDDTTSSDKNSDIQFTSEKQEKRGTTGDKEKQEEMNKNFASWLSEDRQTLEPKKKQEKNVKTNQRVSDSTNENFLSMIKNNDSENMRDNFVKKEGEEEVMGDNLSSVLSDNAIKNETQGLDDKEKMPVEKSSLDEKNKSFSSWLSQANDASGHDDLPILKKSETSSKTETLDSKKSSLDEKNKSFTSWLSQSNDASSHDDLPILKKSETSSKTGTLDGEKSVDDMNKSFTSWLSQEQNANAVETSPKITQRRKHKRQDSCKQSMDISNDFLSMLSGGNRAEDAQSSFKTKDEEKVPTESGSGIKKVLDDKKSSLDEKNKSFTSWLSQANDANAQDDLPILKKSESSSKTEILDGKKSSLDENNKSFSQWLSQANDATAQDDLPILKKSEICSKTETLDGKKSVEDTNKNFTSWLSQEQNSNAVESSPKITQRRKHKRQDSCKRSMEDINKDFLSMLSEGNRAEDAQSEEKGATSTTENPTNDMNKDFLSMVSDGNDPDDSRVSADAKESESDVKKAVGETKSLDENNKSFTSWLSQGQNDYAVETSPKIKDEQNKLQKKMHKRQDSCKRSMEDINKDFLSMLSEGNRAEDAQSSKIETAFKTKDEEKVPTSTTKNPMNDMNKDLSLMVSEGNGVEDLRLSADAKESDIDVKKAVDDTKSVEDMNKSFTSWLSQGQSRDEEDALFSQKKSTEVSKSLNAGSEKDKADVKERILGERKVDSQFMFRSALNSYSSNNDDGLEIKVAKGSNGNRRLQSGGTWSTRRGMTLPLMSTIDEHSENGNEVKGNELNDKQVEQKAPRSKQMRIPRVRGFGNKNSPDSNSSNRSATLSRTSVDETFLQIESDNDIPRTSSMKKSPVRDTVKDSEKDSLEASATAFLDRVGKRLGYGVGNKNMDGEERSVGDSHYRDNGHGTSIDWELPSLDNVVESYQQIETLNDNEGESNQTDIFCGSQKYESIRLRNFIERIIILSKKKENGRWFPYLYEVIISQWIALIAIQTKPSDHASGNQSVTSSVSAASKNDDLSPSVSKALNDASKKVKGLTISCAPILLELIKKSLGFRIQRILRHRARQMGPEVRGPYLVTCDQNLLLKLEKLISTVTDACLDNRNFDSNVFRRTSIDVNDALVRFLRDLFSFFEVEIVHRLVLVYFSRYLIKDGKIWHDRDSKTGVRCAWEVCKLRLNAVTLFIRFPEFVRINKPITKDWGSWPLSAPPRATRIFFTEALKTVEDLDMSSFATSDGPVKLPTLEIPRFKPHWLAEIVISICLAAVEHVDPSIKHRGASLLLEMFWSQSQQAKGSGNFCHIASMYVTFITKILGHLSYLAVLPPKHELRKDILPCVIFVLQSAPMGLLRALWRKLLRKSEGVGRNPKYGGIGESHAPLSDEFYYDKNFSFENNASTHGKNENTCENDQEGCILDVYSLLNLCLKTFEYEGSESNVNEEKTSDGQLDEQHSTWRREFILSEDRIGEEHSTSFSRDNYGFDRCKSEKNSKPKMNTNSSRKWYAHDGAVVIINTSRLIVNEMLHLLKPTTESNRSHLNRSLGRLSSSTFSEILRGFSNMDIGASKMAPNKKKKRHRRTVSQHNVGVISHFELEAPLNFSVSDTIIFSRACTSLYLHTLSLNQSDIVIVKTLTATVEIVKIFGIKVFFAAVGETLQHWMRVVLEHCGARRANVRIEALEFLALILRLTWDSFGSLFRVRVPLLAVQSEVMERIVKIAASRYYREQRSLGVPVMPLSNEGAEGSLVTLMRTFDRLEMQHASKKSAFKTALKRLADTMKKLLRAYIGANALAIHNRERTNSHYPNNTKNIPNQRTNTHLSVRLRSISSSTAGYSREFLGERSKNDGMLHDEAVEDSFRDAADVFSPIELPVLRVAWLRKLAGFHSFRKKFAEEATCHFYIYQTLRQTAKLHDSIWTSVPFVPWLESANSINLDNEGPASGPIDCNGLDDIDVENMSIDASHQRFDGNSGKSLEKSQSFRRLFYRVASSLRDRTSVWDPNGIKNLFYGVTSAEEYNQINPWITIREIEEEMVEEIETAGELFLKGDIIESSRCAWSLATLFYSETYNYTRLSAVYNRLSQVISSTVPVVDTSNQLELSSSLGRFYRVWLHGGAPEEVKAKDFVYRASANVKLEEFGRYIAHVMKSLVADNTPIDLILDDGRPEEPKKKAPKLGIKGVPLEPITIKVTPLRPMIKGESSLRGTAEWFNRYIGTPLRSKQSTTRSSNFKTGSDVVQKYNHTRYRNPSRSDYGSFNIGTSFSGKMKKSTNTIGSGVTGEMNSNVLEGISTIGIDRFFYTQPLKKNWRRGTRDYLKSTSGDFAEKSLRVTQLQVEECFPACVSRQVAKPTSRSVSKQSPLEAGVEAVCSWCAVLFRAAVASNGLVVLGATKDPGVGTATTKVIAECIHSSRVKDMGQNLLKKSIYVAEEDEGVEEGSTTNWSDDRLTEDEVLKYQAKLARGIVIFMELLHLLIVRNREMLQEVVQSRKRERTAKGSIAGGNQHTRRWAESNPSSPDSTDRHHRLTSNHSIASSEGMSTVEGSQYYSRNYDDTKYDGRSISGYSLGSLSVKDRADYNALMVQRELQRSFTSMAKTMYPIIVKTIHSETPRWLKVCWQVEGYFSSAPHRPTRFSISDELPFPENSNTSRHFPNIISAGPSSRMPSPQGSYTESTISKGSKRN